MRLKKASKMTKLSKNKKGFRSEASKPFRKSEAFSKSLGNSKNFQKALFLDRDGVLNKDPGYVHRIEDFELYKDVIPSLKELKEFKFFIITNQSGIGRGIYTEEDFHKFNNHLINKLKEHGINIEKTYFCPHPPEENCDCRKPNTKFIKQAEKEFDINLQESWIIGDHPHDIKLGKKTNCKTIYLLTGHGVKHLEETRKELPDYIAANLTQAKNYILFKQDQKIVGREELETLSKRIKESGKTIVTLNGTFDILHEGHEKIIKEAKQQGDVLIVGVNSDISVKQNKGPERPLNKEKARAKMIANFKEVDYVTVFNETTPIKLLEIIKPNIHVNGEEYGENCIEATTVKKHGGKIHIIKLKPGFSTTNIINAIKKS